ncbi:MAG: bifunctional diguanylate cyclase/phosphodiesterase [Eubacteriales bacterium]|nr:bifunctional diguanylate cyclase/phosphodiesterase [Eubacteriales bacterium]
MMLIAELPVKSLSKNALKCWIIAGCVLIIHTLLTWTGCAWWGNYIAPLTLLGCALSLWTLTKKHQANHQSATLFMIGILVYAVADLVWIFTAQFIQVDPGTILIISYLYVVPNVLIAIGIGSLLFRSLHRWNKIQLTLDLITVSLITLVVVAVLFFDTQFGYTAETLPLILYLIFDTMAVTIALTVLVSTRVSPRKQQGQYIILLSMLILTLADGLYVGQELKDQYVPNGLSDWLFISALFILTLGLHLSFVEQQSQQLLEQSGQHIDLALTNEGPFWSVIWIFALPVLTAILHGVNLIQLLYFAAVLLLYLFASLYVQNTIQVSRTLAERTEHNTALQVLVAERTAQLQTINHLVQTDSLTGLLSRNRFLELVDQAIYQKKYSWPLHLVLIDIVRFRNVNNLYGQEIGDQILIQSAQRILKRFGSKALVARMGGNEFALLFNFELDLNDIQHELYELIQDFNVSMTADPFQILLQIQIGVASFPENADNQIDLLKCALTAVEQAKINKNNVPVFFDREIFQKLQRRQEVEMALRRIDKDREFYLAYQPLYNVSGSELMGMEALLRWDSLNFPGIGPLEFIAVAEETGLILDIGRWVMRTAMRQIREWNILNHTQLQVGINISPLQLEDPSFLEQVRELIRETGVHPDWLNFEITESYAMTDDSFGDILQALSQLGASISIDDFGTGYSSYGYLKRYAIDYLKIDKHLIDTLAENSADKQIVQAIIAMANALQIKTVAEGVETVAQVNLLKEMGCHKIQGYVFGKPVPALEFFKRHLSL